jgi:hypothetical protein
MGYISHSQAIDDDFIHAGRYEINVSGRKYPAKPFLRAPYDPHRKKILV